MPPTFPIETPPLDGLGLLPEGVDIGLRAMGADGTEADPQAPAPVTPACSGDASPPLALDPITAAFDLVARVLMAPDAATARHFVAHLIASHLKADFAVVGKAALGSVPCEVRVIAGDTLPAKERHEEIEAALGETLASGRQHLIFPQTVVARSDVAPDTAPLSTLASLAHRQLAEALGGKRALISVPLINTSDEAVGVILVVWTPASDRELGTDAQFRSEFLTCAAAPLSDCFSILDQAQPSRLQSWLATAKRRAGIATGLWPWLICIALFAIGFFPVHYPVRADLTLQPKTRRFIASPIDAPLKEAHVQPGQFVRKGTLLMTLDAEQTHSRLSSLQAEADGALSERSGFLASGRIGDAELARLKAARLAGEIEQLQQHLRRTEIRSPIDGVVLGDDLDPLEGASLRTGQMLCEIAPLDELIGELEIPPDQIMHISIGQGASIKLEAAGRLGERPITRLHPRAEPNAAGKYYFHARIDISNAANELKPGMRGVATIKTDRRPLAWCLFHRLWQRIRTWS